MRYLPKDLKKELTEEEKPAPKAIDYDELDFSGGEQESFNESHDNSKVHLTSTKKKKNKNGPVDVHEWSDEVEGSSKKKSVRFESDDAIGKQG